MRSSRFVSRSSSESTPTAAARSPSKHAQDVRSIGELAIPRAVADALDHQALRHLAWPPERGNDRRAGRCHELPGAVAHPHGKTAQQLDGRGARDRQRTVRALDHSTAERQRRDDQLADRQRIDGPGGADDVDDRVDRADFVEFDVVGIHAVDLAFRFGEPREDLQRQLANPRREIARANQVADRAKRAVRVAGRAVTVSGANVDDELRRHDAAPLATLVADRVTADSDLRELSLERGDVQTAVEKCPDEHIAGKTGECVEVRDSHRWILPSFHLY